MTTITKSKRKSSTDGSFCFTREGQANFQAYGQDVEVSLTEGNKCRSSLRPGALGTNRSGIMTRCAALLGILTLPFWLGNNAQINRSFHHNDVRLCTIEA